MAGSSMVFAYEAIRGITKVTIDWVGDDGTGDITGTTGVLAGNLERIVTDPGTPSPNAGYNITFQDEKGLNFLEQAGDNASGRSAMLVEHVFPMLNDYEGSPGGIGAFPIIFGKITIVVETSINLSQGQIILYIKNP